MKTGWSQELICKCGFSLPWDQSKVTNRIGCKIQGIHKTHIWQRSSVSPPDGTSGREYCRCAVAPRPEVTSGLFSTPSLFSIFINLLDLSQRHCLWNLHVTQIQAQLLIWQSQGLCLIISEFSTLQTNSPVWCLQNLLFFLKRLHKTNVKTTKFKI